MRVRMFQLTGLASVDPSPVRLSTAASRQPYTSWAWRDFGRNRRSRSSPQKEVPRLPPKRRPQEAAQQSAGSQLRQRSLHSEQGKSSKPAYGPRSRGRRRTHCRRPPPLRDGPPNRAWNPSVHRPSGNGYKLVATRRWCCWVRDSHVDGLGRFARRESRRIELEPVTLALVFLAGRAVVGGAIMKAREVKNRIRAVAGPLIGCSVELGPNYLLAKRSRKKTRSPMACPGFPRATCRIASPTCLSASCPASRKEFAANSRQPGSGSSRSSIGSTKCAPG